MAMLVVPSHNFGKNLKIFDDFEPTLGGYKKNLTVPGQKILQGDDFILYSDVLSTVRAPNVLGRVFVPIFCLFSELAEGCRPCSREARGTRPQPLYWLSSRQRDLCLGLADRAAGGGCAWP